MALLFLVLETSVLQFCNLALGRTRCLSLRRLKVTGEIEITIPRPEEQHNLTNFVGETACHLERTQVQQGNRPRLMNLPFEFLMPEMRNVSDAIFYNRG